MPYHSISQERLRKIRKPIKINFEQRTPKWDRQTENMYRDLIGGYVLEFG